MWRSVPGEARIYQQNETKWSYYCNQWRRYYLDESVDTCPLDLAILISVSAVTNSFKIEVQVLQFNLLPQMKAQPDFEDNLAWSTLSKEFDAAVNDPTIFLDN